MIAGRLANAAIVGRWGARTALRCAYAGIAAAATLLALGGALAGAVAFGVLGLGVAGVVPTLLSASRQQLPDESDAATSGIVAAAYLGYVVAAPTIGWLAEALGMRVALPLILGAVALAMSWLSRKV
jgi:predicted MFS family arabinose efflux permease